jgi:nicotinate dehydrogenase subunit A
MPDTSFKINGRVATVTANSDDTLLHVLRNHLDLKGTRYGCGLEECGSCMVLVDDKPSFACTMPIAALANHAVTTIEGLSQDGLMHPVQAAFLEQQAGQCGYCLSGIIMSSVALLKAKHSPTRAEIVQALEPHLCRCGAQSRMIRAVERAAVMLQAEAKA